MAFPETKCSDTFDENTPPIDDPEYISSLGAAIFKGLQSGDAEAVWLMQVKCYIQSFFLIQQAFFSRSLQLILFISTAYLTNLCCWIPINF